MSAIPPATTCPSCTCNCDDSPLSITGSVIGIVTFLYVLLVGLEYWRNAVARAHSDIRNIFHEVTKRLITLDTWEEQNRGAGEASQRMAESAPRALQTLYTRLHQLAWPTLGKPPPVQLQLVFKDPYRPRGWAPSDLDYLERLRTYEIAEHIYHVLDLWQEQKRPLVLWLSWRFVRERDWLREGLAQFDSYMERARTFHEISEWMQQNRHRGGEREHARAAEETSQAAPGGVSGELAKRMQDTTTEVPETTVTQDNKPTTSEMNSAAQSRVIEERNENHTPDSERTGDGIV